MLITLIRNLLTADDKRLVFVMILAYIPALLIAIVMHELAHGAVAYWNGDDTAKLSGRLTLNPVKHFDPIGFLMLAVIGFGWAKPVPIDPRRFRDYKKGMITVSLAGVICNFLIALVATGLFALYLVATKSWLKRWLNRTTNTLRSITGTAPFFFWGSSLSSTYWDISLRISTYSGCI